MLLPSFEIYNSFKKRGLPLASSDFITYCVIIFSTEFLSVHSTLQMLQHLCGGVYNFGAGVPACFSRLLSVDIAVLVLL